MGEIPDYVDIPDQWLEMEDIKELSAQELHAALLAALQGPLTPTETPILNTFLTMNVLIAPIYLVVPSSSTPYYPR